MKLKAFAVMAALACGPVYAQTVEVKDARVCTSMQDQKATSVFMKSTAKDASKRVIVSSPAAVAAEVHETKMEGDVMKMRVVQGGLDLPAAKTGDMPAMDRSQHRP